MKSLIIALVFLTVAAAQVAAFDDGASMATARGEINAKATKANATFTGTHTVESFSGTPLGTGELSSPVIGTKYLADCETWDPLSRKATTGAVVTIAAADADPDTFTTSAQNFVTLGFIPGMTLTVTGDGSNNGTFTIDTVTSTVITLISADVLTTDAEGDSVTLVGHIPYWVVYTPRGDYVGLDDYEGNTLVSEIDITGTIAGNIPNGADITGAYAPSCGELRGRKFRFTAAATVTLPAAAGCFDDDGSACVAFRVRDAEAAVIDDQAGEKINLDGTALAAGTAITSSTAGSTITLCATTDSDGSGTDGWESWGNNGFASE